MPKCRTCEEIKILDLFPVNKSYKSGRATQCNTCQNKRAYGYRDPIKLLMRKFSITEEQAIDFRSREFCEICGKPKSDSRSLCVDHDHESGDVRGVLCDACNKGIGLLQDNPYILMKASEYLVTYGRKNR